jgi:cytochrome P450
MWRVSHLRLAGEHLVLLTHPADVRDVLMVNQRQFKKGRALERAKPLLGEGLLTSEHDDHLRQRRLIQVPGHPPVPEPVMTLRTKHGVRMIPERR